ncbi:MAG TPA: molybdopterin oxidoreductase, partial [Candidatus Eisenbacteria bacterium]|nr:molybdopterin oxidoreductase [Candidatus Eisenbacteria bacterium]
MTDSPRPGGVSRREFMRLLGMSLAFTGVGACARPVRDTIEPWVLAPEQVIPGRPTWYASALTRAGRALGVLVETHEGRPTKIEGNPAHPASLGATDAFAQAALRGLYDPQRSRAPLIAGGIVSWDELVAALLAASPASGAGLRILTGAITSPTFAAVMGRVRARRPGVRWHRWEAVGREHARVGAALAYGRPLEALHDLSAADRVLALDADFVGWDPAGVRSQREFARRRAAGGANGDAHVRLYAVEPAPSLTGDLADHRLALAAADLPAFAAEFGRALGL